MSNSAAVSDMHGRSPLVCVFPFLPSSLSLSLSLSLSPPSTRSPRRHQPVDHLVAHRNLPVLLHHSSLGAPKPRPPNPLPLPPIFTSLLSQIPHGVADLALGNCADR